MQGAKLDCTAKLSEDGESLVCIIVNPGDEPVTTTLEVRSFSLSDDVAQVTELLAPLEAVNTAEMPNAVVPRTRDRRYDCLAGGAEPSLAPHSVTTIALD